MVHKVNLLHYWDISESTPILLIQLMWIVPDSTHLTRYQAPYKAISKARFTAMGVNI